MSKNLQPVTTPPISPVSFNTRANNTVMEGGEEKQSQRVDFV